MRTRIEFKRIRNMSAIYPLGPAFDGDGPEEAIRLVYSPERLTAVEPSADYFP